MRHSIVASSGSLEVIKWVALVLMIGDHINKYLFNGTIPALFELGRLAMPLFGMVLAFNCAQYGDQVGFYKRLITRLLIAGVVSTPFYIALGGVQHGWWPLNIFFTLGVATAVIYALRVGRPLYLCLAAAIFAVGGALVEFMWPAVFLVVVTYLFCKKPNLWRFFGVFVALCSLTWINGNGYALLALPVAAVIVHHTFNLPRFQWLFYGFYPVHLAVLLLVRIPMEKAGYLFFM
jgi:hypothetical protein